MNFIDALNQINNQTITTNGALALKSTSSDLVNLFGVVGALRSRTEVDIQTLFSNAFAEDRLLATKLLFYTRDIRGGLGEVRTFQIILEDIAKNHSDILIKNLKNIIEFGRWDDLFVLIGTDCEDAMWQFVSEQLKFDVQGCNNNQPISLLAKWLKSPKTSSKATSKLGRYTASKLKLTQKEYRLILSRLRSHLNIVESHMSANRWSNISYNSVPSKAMNIYRHTFEKHDTERFSTYIESVSNGEQKINASTLFPYDIVEKILYGHESNKVLEEQWKALPSYIDSSKQNDILIMADTSGSMNGRPLATAIGLAIYFAEKNQGAYHNTFLTFSERPAFLQIKGDTLYEKIRMVSQAPWGMNTDFEKAMNLILDTAVLFKISPDNLPKSLVVISDMEFDNCTRTSVFRKGSNTPWTFHEHLREKFEACGYVMPNIIFWNVRSQKDTFHASCDFNGVQLVSGQSPSVFKTVLNNIGKTPWEAMVSTLNNSRYDCVEI